MTPEVEAELKKIGWARVTNRQRALLAEALKLDGGLAAPGPRPGKAVASKHRRLCLSIVAAAEGLAALSDDMRTSINLVSTPVDERDGGWPDHVGVAVEALHAISPGLLYWADYLAGKPKRGRPKNEPAFQVASALAMIHVIGTDKMPTIGNLADGSGPSGAYGKAVAKVFALLDIKVADVVPLCQKAINDLTPDRIAAFQIATNPRSLSLFASRGVKVTP